MADGAKVDVLGMGGVGHASSKCHVIHMVEENVLSA